MTSLPFDPSAEFPQAESYRLDYKSLRKVAGSTAGFAELAQDCVCFANSAGGTILIGIEDGEQLPAKEQRVDPALPDRIRKRIGELTVNVHVLPEVRRHENGGEYVALSIPRSLGVASTSDGRYFLRTGDTCRPIVGDDVLRLANDRATLSWEELTSLEVIRTNVDERAATTLVQRLRESNRVRQSVKEKPHAALLEHYGLAKSGLLTNLGILFLGHRADRARLGNAPIVQAIKYDDQRVKIAKWSWDDHQLSPLELIDAIWEEIPDFREGYEVPDGLVRTKVPAFDEAVLRELLVNALVHRPYTQRGDIFLNLHPDRLEVVNPGRLPIGVTPRNILHASRRRNEGIARIFHDLGLMEREGSGMDLMYERLLISGRAAPVVSEGADSVHVTVQRRLVQPEVMKLMAAASQRHELSQRERIALALVAQSGGLAERELADGLKLERHEALAPWLGRLLELGLVEQLGKGRRAHYFAAALAATSRKPIARRGRRGASSN